MLASSIVDICRCGTAARLLRNQNGGVLWLDGPGIEARPGQAPGGADLAERVLAVGSVMSSGTAATAAAVAPGRGPAVWGPVPVLRGGALVRPPSARSAGYPPDRETVCLMGVPLQKSVQRR